MILNFYVRFYTRFGEALYVSGTGNSLGNDDNLKPVALHYLNNEFWHGQVELTDADIQLSKIRYKYIFKDATGYQIVEWGNDRIIDVQQNNVKQITLVDTWNHAGQTGNAFYTKPFQEVLLKNNVRADAVQQEKIFTHEFKVKAPLLSEDEQLCITGSSKYLGEWKTTKPLLLVKDGNWWSVKINFANEDFPVVYKYGVYNNKEKKFKYFEGGNNRTLPGNTSKGKITIIHDGFAYLSVQTWKGAGVAIPVFSLRSNQSAGTGEFTDIKLLVDWAKKTGLKLIQLLPINDTTATYTWSDSYPYAAISTFALHPIYLNIEKVVSKGNISFIKTLKENQGQINNLPDVDYDEVIKFKFAAIKELYTLQKEAFKKDKDFQDFLELNKHWLVPYAAFCYLRDIYQTADFSKWSSHSKYDKSGIEQLVLPTQKHYDDIALHYFIQYHLHTQLKESTDYAHQNGVIVKGDLPIGIYRYSCDAWVNPSLYNMDAQAGAPPDDFAIKGQNWGFPTYNWKRMQEDNFAWWHNRFEQMSVYFDAFRIDHILGFFRIWSIPLDAVEGILGRFDPAIPIHINELYHNGVSFNPDRYCQPFINDYVVHTIFGADDWWVKNNFLISEGNSYKLKEEFDTQRKVEDYFNEKPYADTDPKIKQGLFDLVSNVIFFEEEGSLGQLFHFRINMEQTLSYQALDDYSKHKLWDLYVNYFYQRQDDLWRKKAMQKLPGLKSSTNMLVCGEDLGMVPNCVPDVMNELGILSLEIQRMPKQVHLEFSHPGDAPYLSVITPSTHDMSTLRGWWEEDPIKTQHYYNNILGHQGKAPVYCEAYLNKEIVQQHLYSPAMWSIFQLQDILGISATLRRQNPNDERINLPSNPKNHWKYRMHLSLEDLLKQGEFNDQLKNIVTASGR